MFKKFFLSVWDSRRLITTWTRYNIQANYLDTKLGMVWLILQPLLMTLIYSLVFSLVVNRAPRGGVPFVNFFLSGMILWISFNNTILKSATLIAQKVNLMGQIKFPREALVFVLFNEKLVDFLISLGILFFLNLFYGYYPNITYIYIPVIFIIFFSFELGLMFVIATLGLFIRDIPQIVSLILRLLFYISGIIFPASILPPQAVKILLFNPIFFLAESFRNVLFYAEAPDLLSLTGWLVLGIVLLLVGFVFFQNKSDVFADYK